MQWSIALAVGAGGFVGALLRYYISNMVARAAGDHLAFTGILSVNLLGCFFIGVLTAMVSRTTHLPPYYQRLLITGLLGSLTTFSTFAIESLLLIQQGRTGLALVNILLNVLGGLLLAWFGMNLAGMVFAESAEQQRSEIQISTTET